MSAANHTQCMYGRAEPLHVAILEGLDPGIRYAVEVLHDHGIETYESCDGGEGHAYLGLTVRFHGGMHEGYRAFAIARMYALPVSELHRVWTNHDGELEGPTWELTFSGATGEQT